MSVRRTTVFLITYIMSLGLFCFAGYYFYADYTLQMEVQKQHAAQNDRFQTDLAYVDLPRISVTLSSVGNDHSGNIRMDITLEVESKYAARIEGYRSRIADRLVRYAQTLDYEDITRPKATLWLKPEIIHEVNSVSAPAKVKDIIFRQFLVL